MGGGSAGFSRNASMVRPSAATLTMPNAEASARALGLSIGLAVKAEAGDALEV